MIDNNITQIKNKFAEFKAEYAISKKSYDTKVVELEDLKIYYENLQKARALVAEAGQFTQSYLKEYIESMITTALQSVFDEDYRFVIDFDIKRNKPEAIIKLMIRGEEVDPSNSVGGGVLDVVSFALRIVLWSIQNPQSANVIVLDEPYKWLHGNIESAIKMTKEISNKLGIQFIIVSQIPEIADGADKVWEVKHNGKFSEVSELVIKDNLT